MWLTLEINGIPITVPPFGNNYEYEIPFSECGITDVKVTVNAPGSVVIIDGETASNAELTLTDGDNKYVITVNGEVYNLTINNPMPFDKMVHTRWDYRYTVIDNPLNNGGLTYIRGSYKWYRENNPDVVFSTDQSIEAGNPGSTITTEYRVEAMSNRGLIRSCHLPEEDKSIIAIDLNVYPNPVASGQSFYFEAEMDEELFDGAMLEVYDNLGRRLYTQPIRERLTELDGRYDSGAYILILRGKNNFRKEFKLIID